MMHFSTAIRLGAMMKPQGGAGAGNPGGPTSCALGAALDAVGAKYDAFSRDFWPWVESMDYGCPVSGCTMEVPMYYSKCPRWGIGLIPHLNNTHQWTRECIADWVEQRERERGLWDEESVESKPAKVVDRPVGVRR